MVIQRQVNPPVRASVRDLRRLGGQSWRSHRERGIHVTITSEPLTMFLNLLATARSFSTSAVANFPKLKTHSGAKKRWRAIASGKFKRVCIPCPSATRSTKPSLSSQAHANHSHKNVSKRPARKNNLAQTTYSSQSQTATLKKLLPYA